MALKKNVIRSSGLNLVDQVVKLGAVFIITPLMVSSLGDYQYGIWLILMAVFSYYDFLDMGITLSSTRYTARALGAKDRSRLEMVLGTSHRIHRRVGGLAVALGCLGALLSGWICKDASLLSQIRYLCIVYAVGAGLRYYFRIYLVILKSHVRYDLIVVSSIARIVVQSVLLFVLLRSGAGILPLGIVLIGCELAESLLLRWFSRTLRRESVLSMRHYDGGFARELIGYSFYAFLSQVGLHLRDRIDPLVVGGVSGPAIVPVYSIGFRFIGVFRETINSVLGGQFLAAFSQIESSRGAEVLRSSFLKVTRYSVLIAVFGGGTILVYADPFIMRWVGPSFEDSASILYILTLPFALHFMQYPAWSLLYSVGQHRTVTLYVFFGGIINIPISILMGLKWGLYGVVVASALETTVMSLIFVPRAVWLATGVRPVSYVFRHLLGRAVVCALPIVVYYLAIRHFLEPDYLRLIVIGIGQTLLYGVFAWFWFLDRDERSLVKVLLGSAKK